MGGGASVVLGVLAGFSVYASPVSLGMFAAQSAVFGLAFWGAWNPQRRIDMERAALAGMTITRLGEYFTVAQDGDHQ